MKRLCCYGVYINKEKSTEGSLDLHSKVNVIVETLISQIKKETKIEQFLIMYISTWRLNN